MADPLVPLSQENKLTALNKKIIEIKKKIQLSEGQRKANFEECDVKKRQNAERILSLKRQVKQLQVDFTKAKNNDESAERAAEMSRQSSGNAKKRNLAEAIAAIDEDNIRLRKKLDLVRYNSDKQQNLLSSLLKEYEELMNGNFQKSCDTKLEKLLRKKIVSLENQLHKVSVMQMEADTVRKKYRCVRSSLKADAAFYASSLQNLEGSIKEQESEIKRLQEVKEEAIELKNSMREALMKQEEEAMNTSKERDGVILDYRQRVEDRKLELERLERIIFPTTRAQPREEFETSRGNKALEESNLKDPPKDEITLLEETFAKLRNATGVSRTEDVLNRFLGQRATKERLQKMRAATEDEKMILERTRQQLTTEIEVLKFSETKDTDENSEQLDSINLQIEEQKSCQIKIESEIQRNETLLSDIIRILWELCDKLRESNENSVSEYPAKVETGAELLELLTEKMERAIDKLGGHEKYAEMLENLLVDKVETMSAVSMSGDGRLSRTRERPLFPRFPVLNIPSAPTPASEDEEEVPTRNVLKRQAQLLVDTKSRRKVFNFRR